ncbi:hypothetical protein KJR09_04875 [Streptococcus lutetiensis]|uniref:hypothetical protein n=1 Tax=Streptococcus lutetiensis TaxID=150055 RepID=UPI001BDB2147|nr:hypothetical protein [Streptococcus lutetiensis]MBT0910842.1 hypothetical protein [Streptococcus lutetiensis]
MYEIKLKKGGVTKEYAKEYINVEDNLLAVDHNARQSAFISNDKAAFDSKQTRKLSEAYLQMFVDMYGKQFTVADLKTADVETLNVLDELYVDALGRGKSNEEADEDKGKKEE